MLDAFGAEWFIMGSPASGSQDNFFVKGTESGFSAAERERVRSGNNARREIC